MGAPSGSIFTAINGGDLSQIKELLSADPALASATEGGVTPIMAALYRGKFDLAELIAKHKVEIDAFEAVALKRNDQLRKLVESDPALLSQFTGDGWSLLHFSTFFNNPDATGYLLKKGAQPDVRARNGTNNTPIHAAMVQTAIECARLLLDAGADVNAQQEGGWTALMAAAHRGKMEMVQMLLEHGADKSIKATDGSTARDKALELKFTDMAALL